MRLAWSSHPSMALIAVLVIAGTACNPGPKGGDAPTPDPAPAKPAPHAQPTATATAEGSLRLGAAIAPTSQAVSLMEVAKQPDAFLGKTFTTSGTVTAVCQHMGCWMEIKDDASAAHIKMAGHAFFVPKTASGHKARVMARLERADSVGSCEGEGHEGMAAATGQGPGAPPKGKHSEKKGCRAEAEQQLGRPLAKLELVAEGVELL